MAKVCEICGQRTEQQENASPYEKLSVCESCLEDRTFPSPAKPE